MKFAIVNKPDSRMGCKGEVYWYGSHAVAIRHATGRARVKFPSSPYSMDILNRMSGSGVTAQSSSSTRAFRFLYSLLSNLRRSDGDSISANVLTMESADSPCRLIMDCLLELLVAG